MKLRRKFAMLYDFITIKAEVLSKPTKTFALAMVKMSYQRKWARDISMRKLLLVVVNKLGVNS